MVSAKSVHFCTRPATHAKFEEVEGTVEGAKDFDPNFDIVAEIVAPRREAHGQMEWKPPKKKEEGLNQKAYHKDRRLAQQLH